MKLFKVFSVALVVVFAMSFQSEAKFKMKDLKKKFGKDKKEEKAVPAKPEIKYDYVMTDSSDIESDAVKLLPAKSEYKHRITEGLFGPADGTKGAIKIVPFITEGNGKVQIMLLIPAETMKYNKMMLGEIKPGIKGSLEVHSVFFDQADKDKERELFVLYSYEKGGDTLFETAVYDWNKTKFERVSKLEPKLADQYPAINVRRVLRAMEKQPAGNKK